MIHWGGDTHSMMAIQRGGDTEWGANSGVAIQGGETAGRRYSGAVVQRGDMYGTAAIRRGNDTAGWRYSGAAMATIQRGGDTMARR